MNKEIVNSEVVINKNVTGEMGMETSLVNSEEKDSKKVSKKKKEVNEEHISNKEQNKFFIKVSKDSDSKEMVLNLVTLKNLKSDNLKIILKDLVLRLCQNETVRTYKKQGSPSGIKLLFIHFFETGTMICARP